ncbi:MAG: hypothetical protein KAT58_03685 [candidate division Zixibacteria bacterium]|nr:hypothetical protein [candidate division Zixibacteria bacterium]
MAVQLEGTVIDVKRLVNWISATIILFVGILFLTGYVPIPDPRWRWGAGGIIVLYAGIRLVRLNLPKGRKSKKS